MIIAVQGAVGAVGYKATTLLDLNYNSIGTVNGLTIGANADGLYIQNIGDNDNGKSFKRSFTLNTSTYGIDNYKKLRILYMGIITTGSMSVEIKFDDQEWQMLDVIPGKNGLQTIRTFGSATMQGAYFTLRFTSNKHFKLDYIKGVFIVRPMGITY